MVVAHDLITGLGMRPEWGAVNGPCAVSEQSLFEQAVKRLPDHAVAVADANFGVFCGLCVGAGTTSGGGAHDHCARQEYAA